MSLLARAQSLATRMVSEYGETATLMRPGAVDESTSPPTRGADTSFEFSVLPTRPGFADTVSGNTQNGDMPLILAIGDTEPTTDDKIKVGGLIYSIESVKQIRVQAGIAAWKVIARGGVADNAV